MLRTAICHRIFQEKEPGFISHSAASRLLVEDRRMHDWLGANIHFLQPPMLQQATALKKWPDAEGPSQTAWTLAETTGNETFWEFLAAEPERARMFSSSMMIMAQAGANSFNHVVDNYPFADLSAGTVVDLGGSTGGLAFAIADKFPELSIVVQDLPKTIEGAQEKPNSNVKFMGHDYFDAQPLSANLFIYRWCFHDLTDKEGVRVLRALMPALKTGSRVLIVDAVMPEPGTLPNNEERWLRYTMDPMFPHPNELISAQEYRSNHERPLQRPRARSRGMENPIRIC